MGTTLSDPLVGRLLDARYRVESRLARGGMGTVYRATDIRLDRTVALKVMRDELAEDAEFVARFIREAKSAARLAHPNVVAVFDQGEDAGRVFLAMEFVEGRTLGDLIRERGALPPQTALAILQPVLAALAAAHRAGLVHRDIKPENVLLADDGRVKVADFGLARAVSSATTHTAAHGVLLGTVAYLAPEQVQRGVADARSDVYAAGVLLFEMLTGRQPFTGDNPITVAYQHVHDDVPAPSTLAPGVPAALDALVARACARDPDDRPADAARFLAEVAAAHPAGGPAAPDSRDWTGRTLVVPLGGDPGSDLASDPRGDPRRGGDGGPAARPGTGSEDSGASGAAPRGRRPLRARPGRVWLALALVLLLVALVGTAAWWAGEGRWTRAPGLLQLTVDQARQKAAADGLTVTVAGARVFSETVPADLVAATSPAPGARILRGGTVTLTLSAGPERYAVPDLRGRTVAEATAGLAQVKLVVGTTSEAYDETVPAGSVVSTDPPPGTQVPRDTAVRLVLSKGVPPVAVPNVVGKPADAARVALQSSRLQVAEQQAYDDTVPKGAVIRQDPAGGAQVPRGTTVTIVVSQGPPLVTVPNVVGKQFDQAQQILQAAGFKVVRRDVLSGFFGTVRAQDPAGGAQVPKGSTVTLLVV